MRQYNLIVYFSYYVNKFYEHPNLTIFLHIKCLFIVFDCLFNIIFCECVMLPILMYHLHQVHKKIIEIYVHGYAAI